MTENTNVTADTAASDKERRKTAHLTEAFRSYNTTQLSNLLGIQLNDEQAYAIFKLVQKIPLRFLSTLSADEVDQEGNKSVPLPGVGKFIIRNTTAMGRKLALVSDGVYPRYKFYPATVVEAEVEHYYGIVDPENAGAYEKMMLSEAKLFERVSKQLGKKFTKIEGVVEVKPERKVTLEDVIRGIIREEMERTLDRFDMDSASDELLDKIGDVLGADAGDLTAINESGFPGLDAIASEPAQEPEPVAEPEPAVVVQDLNDVQEPEPAAEPAPVPAQADAPKTRKPRAKKADTAPAAEPTPAPAVEPDPAQEPAPVVEPPAEGVPGVAKEIKIDDFSFDFD